VALLRIVKANLRRLVVSQVDPEEVGVFSAADNEDSKTEQVEEGDSKEAEVRGVRVP